MSPAHRSRAMAPAHLRTYFLELPGSHIMGDGALAGVCAFYHDVSQRKGAELALHQLSARWLELQDEERRRIERELHDTTVQSIFGLTMNLTRIQESIGKERPE